jgi:hypothetical protein
MAQHRQPFDLREVQKALLEEDMWEERGNARGAPPRGRAAGPPRPGPLRAGRAGPPPGARPRPGDDWEPGLYAPGPVAGPYREAPREPPRRNERGLGIDTHEILKAEAFSSEAPGCDDHFDKSIPCPTSIYGVSDQYITLDSFYKLPSSDIGRGRFHWNLMIQGVTGDQVVGVRDKMDTIIEIQIAAFSMPIPPEVPYVTTSLPLPGTLVPNQLILVHNNNNNSIAPYSPLLTAVQYPPFVSPTAATAFTPWVNNPYSQVPFLDRFTIQFAEAGLQSFSDRNGARHHFEFGLSTDGVRGLNPNMLTAAPLSGRLWDSYVFTDPLKSVDGITLVFRNPDVPISFLPDVLYNVSALSDASLPTLTPPLPAPALPTPPGPYLAFTMPTGFGLNVGDRVYITGFNSGISVLDSYVNRPDGQVVADSPGSVKNPSGTPLIYPNVFWLDPAIDLVSFPSFSAQSVTVSIAKRRLRIPIRLRRIIGRLTNYLSP